MNKSKMNQESARQAWTWLWDWVKRNKHDVYKSSYTTAKLAQWLECTPGAVSSWKLGRMNFDDAKYGVVVQILDEWCAMLPEEGWVTPFHYSDEDNGQHLFDYKDALIGHQFVDCDLRCLCGKLTPSAGTYCMYCKRRLPHELDSQG